MIGGHLVWDIVGCGGEPRLSFVGVVRTPGSSIAGFAGGTVAGVAVPRADELAGFFFASFAGRDAVCDAIELEECMLLEFCGDGDDADGPLESEVE